jgi:hypothetical protein
MPHEILEKIIGFAIGTYTPNYLLIVRMLFLRTGLRGSVEWLRGSVEWWQRDIPNLLLVSKTIRRAAQSLLPKLRVDLCLDGDTLFGSSPQRKHKHRLAVRHFKRLVGKEPDDIFASSYTYGHRFGKNVGAGGDPGIL